jgi:hypothetical protein
VYIGTYLLQRIPEVSFYCSVSSEVFVYFLHTCATVPVNIWYYLCTGIRVPERWIMFCPLGDSVETKVETLGLLEHISLGTVKVTDEFFRQVTFGTPVTPGARIFIRRIFPIQDENDEKMMQKVIVTEAIKGESLTHIDDCHVLVIQVRAGVYTLKNTTVPPPSPVVI